MATIWLQYGYTCSCHHFVVLSQQCILLFYLNNGLSRIQNKTVIYKNNFISNLKNICPCKNPSHNGYRLWVIQDQFSVSDSNWNVKLILRSYFVSFSGVLWLVSSYRLKWPVYTLRWIDKVSLDNNRTSDRCFLSSF